MTIMEDKDFWAYVHAHEADDPAKLALGAPALKVNFDVRQAIVQIQARRKFGKKLSQTLADFPDFYFPSLLNGEQCTSDRLADFHTTLIPEGATVVDLTAGLGIDAMHFARRASAVTAVEQSAGLVEALRYNSAGLGVANITAVNDTCEHFLSEAVEQGRAFDVAFIDPARRGDAGQRLFALEDCSPDVVALLPTIEQAAKRLIIKASPMLDISAIISSLSVCPTRVIATGTPTECKELMVIVDFEAEPEATLINAVTIPGPATEPFTQEQERGCGLPPVCSIPKEGGYVFEPFPAVMKTGEFRLLCRQYDLKMFQANTKVYYADEPRADFPGHIYYIEKVLPYASRVIKRFAGQYPRINVAARNFGISADALRAKLGVRDGGDLRLYAITDARNERILLVTRPI